MQTKHVAIMKIKHVKQGPDTLSLTDVQKLYLCYELLSKFIIHKSKKLLSLLCVPYGNIYMAKGLKMLIRQLKKNQNNPSEMYNLFSLHSSNWTFTVKLFLLNFRRVCDTTVSGRMAPRIVLFCASCFPGLESEQQLSHCCLFLCTDHLHEKWKDN